MRTPARFASGDVCSVVLTTLSLQNLVSISNDLLDAVGRKMTRGGAHSQESHLVLVVSIERHKEFEIQQC